MTKINIFISHTSKDHDFVWELTKKLKKDLSNIVNIFIDDWEIKVGDSMVGKIDEAAQNADFFIIVLSKYSLKQEWIQREIDIAFTRLIQKKSKILPVWLDISEEQVPPILLSIKAAVFRIRNIIDEEEYKKLIEPILDHEKAKYLLKFQESVLANIQHLDLILEKEKPTAKEVQIALDLMKQSPEPVYERYFFSKLHSIEWFDILKLEGFFSPEKAPGPQPADKEGFYRIPYWEVLDYLELVSQKIEEPGNEIYIDKLLEIIKEVTNRHKETKEIDSYHIWSSFIRIISNFPNNKISEEIINLIPVWLDSKFDIDLQSMEIIEKLLPKLLTDNQEDIKKAEKLIEYLTEIKKIDEKKSFKIDIYNLNEFFDNNLDTIAQKCSIRLIDIFVKRIKELVSNEYDGTLNSLYDYEEANYLLERPVELFTYILSKILLIKTKNESQNVKQILKSFFEESLPIFTKIALFVIGQNVNIFKDLFWKVLKDKGDKIFEESTLFWGDELKRVLENLGQLNESQRNLLKEKILKAANNYKETLENKDEKEKEKWQSAFKQRIYKALSHDDEFKDLHNKIKKITGMNVELIPAIGKVEVKFGWGESPLTVEEILEKDNATLAKYLIEFRTVDSWKGPRVEALANELRTAVKTKPQNFTENLEPFLNVGYLYISRILEGLKEALTDDKSIDYGKILNFFEDYINRNEFWNDKLPVNASLSVTHTWVISAFGFFVTEGFQNKTYPIQERFFEKIDKILNLLLEKLQIEEPSEEISDHIFYSLNTPLGRVIEVYIKLVLKVLETPYNREKSVIKNFIDKYKELLEQKAIEAYTFLGLYLLNFYFHIDKGFTKEFVSSIKEKEENWEAFMEGYLSSGRVSKEVYEFMKEHYRYALDFSFKNKICREQLIQHISLVYLMGLENLESPSLFNKLIEKNDLDDINKIIWFFYRQRDYLKEDNDRNRQVKGKILKFWETIYNRLKNKKQFTDKEKEVLSNILKLTGFFSELTQLYTDWLKFSAEFTKYSGDFSFFLNDFEKFKNTGDRVKTAKIIGEILLKFKPFDYPEDKIKDFIKYLIETDSPEVKNIAKKICDKYIKNEIYFIKELCEKYI